MFRNALDSYIGLHWLTAEKFRMIVVAAATGLGLHPLHSLVLYVSIGLGDDSLQSSETKNWQAAAQPAESNQRNNHPLTQMSAAQVNCLPTNSDERSPGEPPLY